MPRRVGEAARDGRRGRCEGTWGRRQVAQDLAGLGRQDAEDLRQGGPRDAAVGVVGGLWQRGFLRVGSARGRSGRLGLVRAGGPSARVLAAPPCRDLAPTAGPTPAVIPRVETRGSMAAPAGRAANSGKPDYASA